MFLTRASFLTYTLHTLKGLWGFHLMDSGPKWHSLHLLWLFSPYSLLCPKRLVQFSFHVLILGWYPAWINVEPVRVHSGRTTENGECVERQKNKSNETRES